MAAWHHERLKAKIKGLAMHQAPRPVFFMRQWAASAQLNGRVGVSFLSLSQIESGWHGAENRATLSLMLGLIGLSLGLFGDLFRSQVGAGSRNPCASAADHRATTGQATSIAILSGNRLVLGWIFRLFPSVRDALAIVRPETVLRWHRAGFRSYWRWKSRRRSGRLAVSTEIRKLIREMSLANPLWGAPRIHGELLKLGIDVGQTSVAKYMARRRGPRSQGWKTFLRNHADGIAAMDLFVVPTLSFRLLYGFLSMDHSRRCILRFGVTAHPTTEWLANQLTQACGWERAPSYLIRDRDACYSNTFVRRVRSLGIRDHPTAARSPWQNGYAERLIGSIRRKCLDHVVVFGERHLRYLLLSYGDYYNEARTHLSLNKDAPVLRAVQAVGRIQTQSVLGGLHHRYVRI